MGRLAQVLRAGTCNPRSCSRSCSDRGPVATVLAGGGRRSAAQRHRTRRRRAAPPRARRPPAAARSGRAAARRRAGSSGPAFAASSWIRRRRARRAPSACAARVCRERGAVACRAVERGDERLDLGQREALGRAVEGVGERDAERRLAPDAPPLGGQRTASAAARPRPARRPSGRPGLDGHAQQVEQRGQLAQRVLGARSSPAARASGRGRGSRRPGRPARWRCPRRPGASGAEDGAAGRARAARRRASRPSARARRARRGGPRRRCARAGRAAASGEPARAARGGEQADAGPSRGRCACAVARRQVGDAGDGKRRASGAQRRRGRMARPRGSSRGEPGATCGASRAMHRRVTRAPARAGGSARPPPPAARARARPARR